MVAQLIVPAATAIRARSGPSDTSTPLTPGDLKQEMYLFPLTSPLPVMTERTWTLENSILFLRCAEAWR